VVLINGAEQCNVSWQVGSSATIGTGSSFVGNILALTSITLDTGATVSGRALAQNGAVAMDSNTVSISACIVAPPVPPTLNKSFSPASITAGGISTLTIDLSNANAAAASLTKALVDTLPSGMTVSGAVSTTCGSTVTAPTGGSTVKLTGGSIPANGSCTVTVNVTAPSAGSFINSLAAGVLQTSNGNSTVPAVATLAVAAANVAPTLNKSFGPASITVGGSSTLTLILTNPNATVANLTAPLTDTLPSGVAISGSGSTTCGGTVTAPAGGSTVTLTGGWIPANGSCTVTVDVTAPGVGSFFNTLAAGALQTSNGNSSGPAIATLAVTPAPTQTKITTAAKPPQNQPDTLSATVTTNANSGTPTGTVTFKSGSVTLCTGTVNGSGVATCSFTPTVLGNMTITATYSGDINHTGSSSSVKIVVVTPPVQPTVVLTAENTQLTYPGQTEIYACVKLGNQPIPNGTIQIFDETTLLATLQAGGDGCAWWWITPGLSAGIHDLTAVYNYNGKNYYSNLVILQVALFPTQMEISCWNSWFPYGGNYQCIANSDSGPLPGYVVYTLDGGKPVKLTLVNSAIAFTIPRPAAGNHTLVVTYPQQGNYAAFTLQVQTFTVTPAQVYVAVTPSAWSARVGTVITISSTVTSWSAGNPNKLGSISFFDGATLLRTVNVNANGQASVSTGALGIGWHAITATYSGSANYSSGSTTISIQITK
jgi:hypothetical protein